MMFNAFIINVLRKNEKEGSMVESSFFVE